MPTKRIEIKPKREVLDLDYSTSKSGKKQYVKTGPNKGKVKMKLKSAAKYKKELNVASINVLLSKQDVIIIEQQNPRPGNSAASSASTMKNYGKLLAIAELSEAKVIHLAPGVWKSYFGLDLTPDAKKKITPKEYKDMSIQKAYSLSGWNTSYDGISDAICMLYWYTETVGVIDVKK